MIFDAPWPGVWASHSLCWQGKGEWKQWGIQPGQGSQAQPSSVWERAACPSCLDPDSQSHLRTSPPAKILALPPKNTQVGTDYPPKLTCGQYPLWTATCHEDASSSRVNIKGLQQLVPLCRPSLPHLATISLSEFSQLSPVLQLHWSQTFSMAFSWSKTVVLNLPNVTVL